MSDSPEIEAEPLVCEGVGEAMPDIAGIGILLGFSAQAFLSLALAVWVIFLHKRGRLDLQHEEGTIEHACEKQRLKMVSSMLMVGNDIQMLTGTALMITAYSQAKKLDLYHMHLVYDTVSFVGISNCAALVCWSFITAKTINPESAWRSQHRSKSHLSFLNPRYRVTYFYMLAFLAVTVILEIRLDGWSLTSDKLGACYRTDGVTVSGASHPRTDQLYVGFTAVWLIGTMAATIWGHLSFRKPLIVLAVLQYIVHLYFMIALRSANQGALEGNESEDDWDFGQTTAMLLLSLAIGELVRKLLDYFKFERALKKNGPAGAQAFLTKHDEEEHEGGLEANGPKGVLMEALFETGVKAWRTHSHDPRSRQDSEAQEGIMSKSISRADEDTEYKPVNLTAPEDHR